MNEQKREAAAEIVSQLTQHGIIERRSTAWASPAVWVSKAKRALTKAEALAQGKEYIPMETNQKAGISLRLCVNYTVLNSFLVYPASALPSVKTLFSQFQDSEVLHCLDLTWAYYGCVLSDKSSLLTGFWTGIQSDNTMVFKRAAMGIRSSGSLLSAIVAKTLAPMRKHVVAYSDNVAIHSKACDGPKVLNRCFKLLTKAGFKVKKSKTIIHVQQPVRLLGITYDIKNKRMHLDHEKTQALSQMKPPSDLKMLKSYLGGVQFLVSAMPGCGEHLATLYKCTRKNAYEFPLKEKELQAFRKINEIMIQPENFVYFINYDLEIIIKCDASSTHIGFCVLQYLPDQKRYVSAGYYCKVLSDAQARYSASHREILGVAVALKQLENLIAGASVTCFTDCRGLMLLFKHAATNSKMRRYLEFIQSFEPQIKLKWQSSKDPSFKIVDLLSRPDTAGDPPVLNRNIPSEDEESIEIRSKKLKSSTVLFDDYILLMDYILEQPDDIVTQMNDDSIYIDNDGNICTGSFEQSEVLQYTNTYM